MTIHFELSHGAALGLPARETTRPVVAQMLAESREGVPADATMPRQWMRQIQRQAWILVQGAVWVRIPARHCARKQLFSVRKAFAAALTLGDALTLIHGAAAHYHGQTASNARTAYREARPYLSRLAAVDPLPLAALVKNPAPLIS